MLMKKLRVLVFSASFGAGHLRAAEAVIEALRQREPTARISHLDCGDLLSKTFNTVIKGTYLGMIKRTPKLWGKFYYGTSKIAPDSTIQRFLNHMGQKEFQRCIEEKQPDLIVCTYPTVAGVLSEFRLNNQLKAPLVTIVTDYAVHSQWIHRGVDQYFVGCRDVYDGLAARGINPAKIQVTGIPVSPRFETSLNREEICAKFGLDLTRPTILVMGGAYGVLNGLRGICTTLAKQEFPVQALVVCGQDDKLYRSLDQVVANSGNKILRFGFVNNVEEFMTAADFIITKAGGLTVSEALTKRLPLLIFKPIPGQEEENAAFIRRIGAGKVTNSWAELDQALNDLLKNPQELTRMKRAAAKALPGRTAEKIVGQMLDLLTAGNKERIG